MRSCKTCIYFVANHTKCDKRTYTTEKGQCSQWKSMQPSTMGEPIMVYEGLEDIKEMRIRHQREIRTLQRICKHKRISEWMNSMWAPGHMGNPVKVCEDCGKVVEEKPIINQTDLLTPISEWEEKHNITEARDDMVKSNLPPLNSIRPSER